MKIETLNPFARARQQRTQEHQAELERLAGGKIYPHERDRKLEQSAAALRGEIFGDPNATITKTVYSSPNPERFKPGLNRYVKLVSEWQKEPGYLDLMLIQEAREELEALSTKKK